MAADADRRRGLLFAAGAAAAAILAYLPALWAGFTSDDFLILARLQQTNGLDGASAFFTLGFYDYYRPLVFLSHAIDWELWGMRAAGYHLTNVALHAANTSLVYALGRRVMPLGWAFVGALLFGLHPSSHEAVYWIAARFDLAATFFALVAVLWLASDRPAAFGAGLAAFLLALLSKESALAVPVIVTAHDVLIAGRTARTAAGRLVPMLVVMALYAGLRGLAADLPPAGGSGRLGKLALFAGALGVLLMMARRIGRHPATPPTNASIQAAAAALAISLAAAASAMAPGIGGWIKEKLAFVAYAAFHLVSPIVVPAPPPFFLDQATSVYWLAGSLVCGLVAGVAVLTRPWFERNRQALFLVALVVAALIPVSTMTGGTRYLYLASVGTSLLAALVAASLAPPWRTVARAAVVAVLVLSPVQIVLAGRAWIWASEMARDAAEVAAPRLAPCGSTDLVLLTAPVGIRGVYSNLNDETFSTTGCAAASVRALTRVVRDDVHVEIASAGSVIAWRIPGYQGNVVASGDLRSFNVPLRSTRDVVLDTPIGRLESRLDGNDRVFRFVPAAAARARIFGYYSDGRVRLLPGTVQ